MTSKIPKSPAGRFASDSRLFDSDITIIVRFMLFVKLKFHETLHTENNVIIYKKMIVYLDKINKNPKNAMRFGKNILTHAENSGIVNAC